MRMGKNNELYYPSLIAIVCQEFEDILAAVALNENLASAGRATCAEALLQSRRKVGYSVIVDCESANYGRGLACAAFALQYNVETRTFFYLRGFDDFLG